jgi:hypothetical protein
LVRPFLFFGVLLLFAVSLRAAEGEAGEPGGFLRVGIGARALAMGNAYVAVPLGAETAMWNPSGLGLENDAALESTVSQLSLGRQFDDVALAWPLGKNGYGWGNWSLTWIYFSLGQDFEGRTADTASFYNFAEEQSAYVLSWGRKLNEWVAVGAGLEFIVHSIDVYHATGFGENFGLMLSPYPFFRAGVSVTELFSNITWSTGYEESFPWTVRSGASLDLLKHWLLLSGQLTAVEYQDPAWEGGVELRYHDLVFGRAGYNENGFTVGGGLAMVILKTRASFDYALAPDALDEGYAQRFSLGLIF